MGKLKGHFPRHAPYLTQLSVFFIIMAENLQIARMRAIAAFAQRLERKLAYDSLPEKRRAEFQSYLSHSDYRRHRTARVEPDPEVARVWKECERAFEELIEAKSAYLKIQKEIKERPQATLQGLRKAKYELDRIVLEDSQQNPCCVYTLMEAVLQARSTGLNPRDIDASMNRLEALAAATKLQVSIGTFSDSFTLEPSLSDCVGEFKQEVAKRLDWTCADTKLFLGGIELMDNSKRFFEHHLSPENCDFLAVQVKDKVEDINKLYQDECTEAAELLARDMRRVGLPAATVEFVPERDSAEKWTKELIHAAVNRGLVDITVAAELLFQVEFGEIAEKDARTKVRRHAQAQCSEVEDPLDDVDSKYTEMAKDCKAVVEERHKDLRHLTGTVENIHRYGREMSKQLRSWTIDSNQTMQGRAIPTRPR